MNKEVIKIETNEVEKRIYALISATENVIITDDHDAKRDTINTILNEYIDRLDYLKSAKEYMITFVGGGWNTIDGFNEEDALLKAKAVYNSSKHTQVQSVRLSSAAGIKAAMSLFH